ncbi:MAG: hypothetical protein RR423_01670 [Hydrogenoanaerobacterium sp.]
MKKLANKRNIVALCVLVPIATALAFVPKIVAEHRRRKYTSTSI